MAGITKRVGEIGAESIHTFPETGERPRKVQALVNGMFTGILYGEKHYQKQSKNLQEVTGHTSSLA